MRTGVVTDSFSTLSGTAATIYGNTDFFREVQNQVYKNSVTSFLDIHRPSSAFRDLVEEEIFTSSMSNAFQSQYDKDSDLTDYIDINNFNDEQKEQLLQNIIASVYSSMDSKSTYGNKLTDHVFSALRENLPRLSIEALEKTAIEICEFIKSDKTIGKDIESYARFIDNNPQTKLSVPPPDDILILEDSVDLGSDYRGVKFTSGYLSPQQYYNDIPYPKYETAFNLPGSLSESLTQGYFGYPSITGLEGGFSPETSDTIANFPPKESQYLGKSLLSEIPNISDRDAAIYQISLIGNNLGRLTGVDFSVSSNGDLLDPKYFPTFEQDNADSDSGNPALARAFSPTFS